MKANIQLALSYNGLVVANINKKIKLPELSTNNIQYEFKLTKTMTIKSELMITSINGDTGEVLLESNKRKQIPVDEINKDNLDNDLGEMKDCGWTVKINEENLERIKHPSTRLKNIRTEPSEVEVKSEIKISMLDMVTTYFGGDRALAAKAAGCKHTQQINNWIAANREVLRLADGSFLLESKLTKVIQVPTEFDNDQAEEGEGED